MGLLLRLARQWIAGENAQQGIERVRQANSKGILGLLNLLGEHVETRKEIDGTVQEYLKLLDLIDQEKVFSQISIKPTQMGLNLDFDYCVQNYLKVAESCANHANNMLWIDMENSPFTQKSIELYSKILAKYPNTGLAIQSYLKRSEQDLKNLVPQGAKIRLVKGAYNESPEIAYKTKREVTQNYSTLLTFLFASSTSENFTAVATHDGKMIDHSKRLAKEYPSTKYEYEMLMGVRDNLKKELVSEGKQVREYVPYGPKWLSYSIRRIREKKSNILLLGRSLFVQ
jgi:proline dehydrogenase